MAAQKKAALPGKAGKPNLSGGSGDGDSGSDLKGGGGAPKRAGTKVKKPAVKGKK